MKIEVICPIYNAEKYIYEFHGSLLNQRKVDYSIRYILTESEDRTEKICEELGVNFEKIRKEEFSHSLTREKAIMESSADIIVLITQDIKIFDELFLFKLTKDIINGNCEAVYARQISNSRSIEKYIREFNYPNVNITKNKDLIDDIGLNCFFFSDAAAAIKRDIFIKLNGYDKKDLIINEDMYFAYKLIMNGYKIKYEIEAIVEHSHEFYNKEFFKRYFDTGVFFAMHPEFKKYSKKSSGLKLFKYVFACIIKEKKFNLLYQLFLNFSIRFIGYALGYNYKKLNKNLVYICSLNKYFWRRNIKYMELIK